MNVFFREWWDSGREDPEEFELLVQQHADAVRMIEREACAAECDRLAWALDHGGNKYRRPADAEQCARAIRMRSNMK